MATNHTVARSSSYRSSRESLLPATLPYLSATPVDSSAHNTHTHTSYMHTRAPHAWTGRTQGHNNSNSSGSSSSKPRNDDGNDNSNRAAAQQQQRTLKERIDVAVARSLQLEVHLRELFPTDELFALQQEHAQSM